MLTKAHWFPESSHPTRGESAWRYKAAFSAEEQVGDHSSPGCVIFFHHSRVYAYFQRAQQTLVTVLRILLMCTVISVFGLSLSLPPEPTPAGSGGENDCHWGNNLCKNRLFFLGWGVKKSISYSWGTEKQQFTRLQSYWVQMKHTVWI